MSDEDLCFASASRLREWIARKDVSPVEVTRAVLARIETLDPRLNAFATLTADAAMAAAREAEAAVARGASRSGALHGVPVTVKDLVVTAGVPTEFGSHTRKGYVPAEDSPLVTRLKAAGAVPLGKTTTSEYGWKGVSESPLTGITSNPWKLGYNAGASSAGAGAAAAAGYGPLHQGSDGAGSIRMPAPLLRRVRPQADLRSRSVLAGRQQRPGHAYGAPDPDGSRFGDDAEGHGRSPTIGTTRAWRRSAADYPARCADGIAGTQGRLQPRSRPLPASTRTSPPWSPTRRASSRSWARTSRRRRLRSDPTAPELIPVLLGRARPCATPHFLPEWEDRMDPGSGRLYPRRGAITPPKST